MSHHHWLRFLISLKTMARLRRKVSIGAALSSEHIRLMMVVLYHKSIFFFNPTCCSAIVLLPLEGVSSISFSERRTFSPAAPYDVDWRRILRIYMHNKSSYTSSPRFKISNSLNRRELLRREVNLYLFNTPPFISFWLNTMWVSWEF
jgi:hypothetical protein